MNTLLRKEGSLMIVWQAVDYVYGKDAGVFSSLEKAQAAVVERLEEMGRQHPNLSFNEELVWSQSSENEYVYSPVGKSGEYDFIAGGVTSFVLDEVVLTFD